MYPLIYIYVHVTNNFIIISLFIPFLSLKGQNKTTCFMQTLWVHMELFEHLFIYLFYLYIFWKIKTSYLLPHLEKYGLLIVETTDDVAFTPCFPLPPVSVYCPCVYLYIYLSLKSFRRPILSRSQFILTKLYM